MKDCTCLGSCRGAAGLGPGWNCVVDNGLAEELHRPAGGASEDAPIQFSQSTGAFSDDKLRAAVKTILRGFDEGVFVRSIANDHDPAWAMRLFPYIQALAVAQQELEELNSTGSTTGSTEGDPADGGL